MRTIVQRLFLGISFLMTGLLPLSCGLYLAYLGQYLISIGCLLVAVCGFQQIYHSLRHQEVLDGLYLKIREKEGELQSCQEENAHKTKSLADLYGQKLEEQEAVISRHRAELIKANRMLEDRNKEIWKLKRYD